jgi:hypothetical protein
MSAADPSDLVAQAGSRRPHVIFTIAIAMRFRGFELKVCRRVAQRTGPTSGTEIRKSPIGDFKNRGALRRCGLGWTLRCLKLDLVRPVALTHVCS